MPAPPCFLFCLEVGVNTFVYGEERVETINLKHFCLRPGDSTHPWEVAVLAVPYKRVREIVFNILRGI